MLKLPLSLTEASHDCLWVVGQLTGRVVLVADQVEYTFAGSAAVVTLLSMQTLSSFDTHAHPSELDMKAGKDVPEFRQISEALRLDAHVCAKRRFLLTIRDVTT